MLYLGIFCDAFGSDGEFTTGVVSSGAPYVGEILADLTSSVESPAYNIRNGGAGASGKGVDSYERHPNVLEHTADGTPTTAAGKFQINFPTWNDITAICPGEYIACRQWLYEGYQ